MPLPFPELRELRKPQQECVEVLRDACVNQEDAACQVWCGAGKTLIFFYTLEELGVERVVLGVPTLALLRQVKSDYIDRCGLLGWDFVCSEPGSEFDSAPDYSGHGHVLTT